MPVVNKFPAPYHNPRAKFLVHPQNPRAEPPFNRNHSRSLHLSLDPKLSLNLKKLVTLTLTLTPIRRKTLLHSSRSPFLAPSPRCLLVSSTLAKWRATLQTSIEKRRISSAASATVTSRSRLASVCSAPIAT